MDNPKYWTKQVEGMEYLVSVNLKLLSRKFVAAAFDDMPWAKSLSPDTMDIMLRNSCIVCLYTVERPPCAQERFSGKNLAQIGMVRVITDYTTFAYLTDVYIEGSHRGKGLGKWMISCTKEIIDEFPALRRVLLLSMPDVGVALYGKVMGMVVCGDAPTGDVIMSTVKKD